jgi:hypothetical protein
MINFETQVLEDAIQVRCENTKLFALLAYCVVGGGGSVIVIMKLRVAQTLVISEVSNCRVFKEASHSTSSFLFGG